MERRSRVYLFRSIPRDSSESQSGVSAALRALVLQSNAGWFRKHIELAVAFALAPFQLIQPMGKFLTRGEERAKPYECTRNSHVDLNRSFASQDARQHWNAQLSESVRQITLATTPFV